MYSVGIVGCGVIGTRLADSFTEHDATNVRAACDVDEATLSEFAETYDCEETYTDYRELVTSEEVDVVYVGVPPALHRDVVEAALDAGKHVVCEKPIAEDAEEGQEMVDAAADADVVTAVNLPFRYTPGFVAMRERIAAGESGDPRRVRLTFRFPRWPREWQDVSWLETREQGGPMREVGTHFLFGVHELFGPIDRVSAAVRYVAPGKYEGSVAGHFSTDAVDGTVDLVCGADTGERNEIEVVCDDETLALTDWYRLVRRGPDGEDVLDETRESTTLTLVDELVTELDGGDGDLVSFAEATAVQRVLDAVFESGDAGGELVADIHA